MTITEKIEIYGKFFMDLATDEEVVEYWNMVDGVAAQAALDVEREIFESCEQELYAV